MFVPHLDVGFGGAFNSGWIDIGAFGVLDDPRSGDAHQPLTEDGVGATCSRCSTRSMAPLGDDSGLRSASGRRRRRMSLRFPDRQQRDHRLQRWPAVC
jgi:hypothetical protein